MIDGENYYSRENMSKIAVVIPCFNEALTIKKVVADFRKELPDADIYVIDNNSSDGSAELAKEEGAIILHEKRQGKGFVVSLIVNKIDADYYVMVDGDDTYPAENIHEMLNLLYEDRADMVVGKRLASHSDEAFRPLHKLGNNLVSTMINLVFSSDLTDPMSGYRAFTQEVALALPVIAKGFDIETEMTMQLLYRNFVIQEIEIYYRDRPSGSPSKLNTFRDGFIVILKIFKLVIAIKPLTFFGSLAIISVIIGFIIGFNPIMEYLKSQEITSFSNAILASFFVFLSIVFVSLGLIITTVNLRLLEISALMTKWMVKNNSPDDSS
jgi:glycosyltransferase involved in cell wall biosynthesis